MKAMQTEYFLDIQNDDVYKKENDVLYKDGGFDLETKKQTWVEVGKESKDLEESNLTTFLDLANQNQNGIYIWGGYSDWFSHRCFYAFGLWDPKSDVIGGEVYFDFHLIKDLQNKDKDVKHEASLTFFKSVHVVGLTSTTFEDKTGEYLLPKDVLKEIKKLVRGLK